MSFFLGMKGADFLPMWMSRLVISSRSTMVINPFRILKLHMKPRFVLCRQLFIYCNPLIIIFECRSAKYVVRDLLNCFWFTIRVGTRDMMSGLSELALPKILPGRQIAKGANRFTVKERLALVLRLSAVKPVLPNEVGLVGKILQGNYLVCL